MSNNYKLDVHDHSPEQWSLKYNDSSSFYINTVEDGEGNDLIRIKALKRNWEKASSQLIDFSRNGIGGLVGGSVITTDSFYLIWAFFNSTGTEFYGFGCTKQPQETATNISGTSKGSTCTLTLPGNGYSFTQGASVTVYTLDSDWNTGIITEIVSRTSVKVLLDNESWGTALSGTTPVITQYNKFRPYNTGSGDLVYGKYKLLSSKDIYINSSGNLQMVYNPQTGFLVQSWWDKDLTSLDQVLHPDYMLLSGNVVINPLSPVVGETLRDLITDKRFIRAHSTSGEEEDDAFQCHRHSHVNFIPRAVGGSFFGPGAYTTDGYIGNPSQAPTFSPPRVADETRPINISMVPIMRVVQ